MKPIHYLFFIACTFIVLFIFCRDGTNCDNTGRIRTSRERSLLTTQQNPSLFNKALDTI